MEPLGRDRNGTTPEPLGMNVVYVKFSLTIVRARTQRWTLEYRACYLGCFKGASKAVQVLLEWYRSSYGTDVDNSEIAIPVIVSYKPLEPREGKPRQPNTPQ